MRRLPVSGYVACLFIISPPIGGSRGRVIRDLRRPFGFEITGSEGSFKLYLGLFCSGDAA
jgi:hypothetical protein